MNTTTEVQNCLIVSNGVNSTPFFDNWAESNPSRHMGISIRDFTKMHMSGENERMVHETMQFLALESVKTALKMNMSVSFDVEWDLPLGQPFFDELYLIAQNLKVPVETIGDMPVYTPQYESFKAMVPNPSLPKAVWVDVDGTLARMADRSPFDWKRVGEDTPIEHVIDAVKALQADGYAIVIMSGRDSVCINQTGDWLRSHGIEYDAIHMRAVGDDKTPDNRLKYDLYWEHVADKFDIRFALDDRQKVVDFTRDVLKIPVFQVAPGNF